ncbi:helix-turn-helix domain-containing protein [Polaribacter sargassicola]|uniref:helix-turn-helix domain-containing protein n=1 Tax=Polaribacter sargassicola TaxID=2836891 RepID=UPI001F449872|nr:response regulator transcription factor [Polaribacter sp. DS7-9]MCG1037059.1 helix-turn-helix transcriptional regulator [Polaribacter sp. DS7-9]
MLNIQSFSKIKDYHNFANLSAPKHPLISLIDYSEVKYPKNIKGIKFKQEYYTIGLKRNISYEFYYGQQEYDFDEGIMTFISPNQVLNMESNPNINLNKESKASGWLLCIHPDFFWNTSLSKLIKSYDFFGYAINEALFLSEKEELMMIEILKNIKQEYEANIDAFSQKIIVSQIELLLNYAERFYGRQFITRKKSNHQLLEQVENLLSNYFNQNNLIELGLPNVEYVSNKLNLSSNYLSSMLKSLTGMSTQQHIHNKIIEKAKEQLTTNQSNISEIAYNLGFEYPSSFNKLFKNKTKISPLEFRKNYS